MIMRLCMGSRAAGAVLCVQLGVVRCGAVVHVVYVPMYCGTGAAEYSMWKPVAFNF